MWCDIYPLSMGYPGPAFDIRPRKPKRYASGSFYSIFLNVFFSSYVLRCIIWNTREVPFDEVSITGEKMSDIYVKGWLQGLDSDKQKTDVHYRSMDGDGYFNWRFVFDFDYLPAEQTVSIKKKEHFWSLDETQNKQPPVFNLQIWDNDKFSADDFIGNISLDLNKMVKPVKDSDKCGLQQLDVERMSGASLSLFEQRRMKGWWPCTTDGGKIAVSLFLEMLIFFLTGFNVLG
jgi:dysferlin